MSNLDELEKLQELKLKGIITNEEFEEEKNSLLNGEVKNKININKKHNDNLNRICKNCGALIEENEAKYCGKCGNKIKNKYDYKQFIFKYKFLIIGITVILIGFIGVAVYNEELKLSIPHITEITVKEAKEKIGELGLKLEINGSSNESDIVISQEPQYGSGYILKGDTIKVSTITKEEFEKQKEEKEKIRNKPTNDAIISCAKTAIRRIANYEPEFGTTSVLEEDDYGRYLVLCYAKLVNGFGAGKYNVYYVVLNEVTKQNGEWYYKINPANGIINSANYGDNEDLAIESAKKLNDWNEPKESDEDASTDGI